MTAPNGFVVVSGATQGLTLLSRMLLREGEESLAIEDPSNAILRRLLGRLGVKMVDVPVDKSGLRVDMLAATKTRAVLCTPAHQYPSGVVLSPPRREQLLRWAVDVGGLIIEDDYDAEFRYDRAPPRWSASHQARPTFGTTSDDAGPRIARSSALAASTEVVPGLVEVEVAVPGRIPALRWVLGIRHDDPADRAPPLNKQYQTAESTDGPRSSAPRTALLVE